MKINKFISGNIKLALPAILLLGGFLRFYKLDWGESFFFHPDEYHIAIAVSRLDFPSNLNPELFSYGSFTVYLIYFSRLLLTYFNPEISGLSPILIGRFFSALFSTASILLVYFIAHQIFEKRRFAILSAFIAATIPGLVQQAHFATPESSLTFWILLTVALWLTLIENHKIRYLAASSLTFGAAAATKIVAVVYLPLLVFVSIVERPFWKGNLKKKVQHALLPIFLIIFSFSSFLTFFPYSILDQKGFINSMKYETSVARGSQLVFYTRQFIDTGPFVFQLKKVFPYVLGPAVYLLGGLGLIIALISLANTFLAKRGVNKKNLIVLLSFFAYLIPNAILFVKWTRFMTPTIPFLCIFSVYSVYFLHSRKGFLSKYVAPFLTFFLIAFTTIWGVMFFSIYTKTDVRLAATSWVNQNVPQSSVILTEEGNTLEVPLSGKYIKRVFNFYNLDSPKSRNEILELLASSDYFIIQSRRVFINHQRIAKEFPETAAFYDKLFYGDLGFTELKEISSFPSLGIDGWKLGIDDELAEETWSVFDHPVIRIFQKTKNLSWGEYKKLLGY